MASPSPAVIAVTVKIQIVRMTVIGQGDGEEVVWRRLYGQWTTNSDSAPQETPLNICRMVICHCEFNRGQWPQVTLVDLDPHLAQCQGSHPVMYWHQSHQLSPFKSIARRQVAFTHDFAEILRRLFLLWRHNFVTWPDPTKFFSPKVAQRMPHKLWNISARSSKRCGVQLRKTHGGGLHQPPPDRGEG